MSKKNIVDIASTMVIFFTVAILYDFLNSDLSLQESLKHTLSDDFTYWMIVIGFIGSFSRVLVNSFKTNRVS